MLFKQSILNLTVFSMAASLGPTVQNIIINFTILANLSYFTIK